MPVMEEPPDGEPEYALHGGACEQPVVRLPGESTWRHVQNADAAFCGLMFPHLYETPE